HSYLAVDLFFIMSGLVVSRAYESQLLQGSMTFAAFCITRAVRLSPLYIAGTLLGLCYAYVKSRLGHDAGMDLRAVVPTLLLNVFFIPDLSHSTGPFPFDPAAWSLSLEWSINLVYAHGPFTCLPLA